MLGDWMQTYRGRQFWYLAPTADDIDIEEIATVLARIPRFAGHTKFAYSVAQHSVLVSKLCPEQPLAGLLHDAHEAFIGDLGTPLKETLECVLPGFKNAIHRITDAIDLAIARKFDLGVHMRISPAVKLADKRALATEKRDLMAPPPCPWLELPEPDSETIPQLTESEARTRFLGAFDKLR